MAKLDAGETVTLRPTAAAEDELVFASPADRYLHVEATSRSGDTTLQLMQGASSLGSIALRHKFEAPEHLIAIAETGGSLRLVARLDSATDSVHVDVRLVSSRPATESDRVRVRAERRYLEAWSVGRTRDAASQDQAATRYREAIVDFVALGDAEGEAKSRHNLASILRRQRNRPDAEAQLRKAIPRWHAAENPAGAVDSMISLASLQRAARQFDTAVGTLTDALVTVKSLDDPNRLGRVLNNLGGMRLSANDVAGALEAYEHALAVREDAEDLDGQATTLNNIGMAHKSAGRYHRAAVAFDRAAILVESLDATRLEAVIRNNQGTTANALGDYALANQHLTRALALAKARGDARGEASTRNNMGWSAHHLGDLEDAETHFRHALAIVTARQDTDAMARALTNLARNDFVAGRPALARERLEQALALRRDADNTRGEAKTLSQLAVVLESADDIDTAQAHAERARLLAASGEDPRTDATALAALARIAVKRGALALAQRRATAAVARVEQLRDESTDPRWKASFLASRHDVYALLVDILIRRDAVEPGSGWAAGAFAVAEQAKARSLLDTLRAAAVTTPADRDPVLVAREQQLREHVRALAHGRDRGRAPSTAADSEHDRQLQSAIAEHRMAAALLAMPTPSGPLQPGPNEADPARLSTLLGTDTVVIEFMLGKASSALFIVDSEGVTAHRLPSRATIETETRALIAALTARAASPIPDEDLAQRRKRIAEADDAARRLTVAVGRMLLAPAADALDGRRLVIVPDGVLTYLPFAALAAPRTGEPLLLDREIVTLPSLGTLAALRERAPTPPASRDLVVVADPVVDRHDSRFDATVTPSHATSSAATRLPGARAESEAVAVATSTTLLTGFAATRRAVLDGALAAHRRVHIATHGVLDARHPELSALTLSSFTPSGDPIDGALRLGDVYRLRLDAELVVLSACETALGPVVRGEGSIGLARGFLHAGARQVVASLWPVRDDTTAYLMRHFDDHLGRGLSTADALRQAQLAILAAPETSSPYFWAGFSSHGDWRAAQDAAAEDRN